MNRDEALDKVLSLPYLYVLLEYPTGYGKSRLAIEREMQYLRILDRKGSLLIVVNRNVHKDNWRNELIRWIGEDYESLVDVEFSTYAGLHKVVGKSYDCVIFDECHHLTSRCMDMLGLMSIDHATFLSATVSKEVLKRLQIEYPGIYQDTIKLREAIKEEVLPDPLIYLIPMWLDMENYTETIVRNPKSKGGVVHCKYPDRWNYIRQGNKKIVIDCTQFQYMEDLDSQILYWKKKFKRSHSELAKNIWLRLCGSRLKYLSDLKTPFIKELLEYLKDYRTLTFCNGIEHTEQLGKYCIHSENILSNEFLSRFNKGDINHITACNILNEGMNLVNCKIGIYASLNSSDIIIKQRTGRLLRHPEPVIIIPYYKNTREEEIVKKMLENYNEDLVKSINCKEEVLL